MIGYCFPMPDEVVTPDGWVTAIATVAAAVIAALVVVGGYVVQQRKARSDRRARTYAEAIRAVNDYLEAPYRVVRRDGSHAARMELSSSISEIQSRFRFYEALLSIQAPPHVAANYGELVECAREEAGGQMSEAWKRRPVRHDRRTPRGARFEHPLTDQAMKQTLESMRADLG